MLLLCDWEVSDTGEERRVRGARGEINEGIDRRMAWPLRSVKGHLIMKTAPSSALSDWALADV